MSVPPKAEHLVEMRAVSRVDRKVALKVGQLVVLTVAQSDGDSVGKWVALMV